jgi:hypothetical protein
MAPKKEPVISAFERKRLENIANNNAILSEITTTADKIIPKPAPPKPKRPAAPRAKREPVKREPLRPTRQSSRLAGLDADSGVLKRKAEVEAEAEAEKARAKKMRVSGDLNLGDIQVDGRKWEGGLEGLAGLKGLTRGAQAGVRTFTDEDVKSTTDKGLKDVRLRMGALKLYEKWPVQGTSLARSFECGEVTADAPRQTSRSSRSGSTRWASIPPNPSPSSLPAIRRAQWACLTPRRSR